MKATGYDKLVSYKHLTIAIAAFVTLLLVPTTASMVDVGVEYSAGEGAVYEHLARELFRKPFGEVDQWQAVTVRVLEANMMQGALGRNNALKRTPEQISKMGIPISSEHYRLYRAFIESQEDAAFLGVMKEARSLRHDRLSYQQLDAGQRAKADRSIWHIKVCLAMTAFVVICFLTEAIPLPGVAFCVGLILVFSGIVGRSEVASLFWSDAAWFIMGSLMFAAAFVKTGVDKRICLTLFRFLAKPRITIITGILILVISPAASFISDHALAAMFLPIAMALYANSLSQKIPADPELGKLLVICIAMACNIGGFGAPSGGARNVIIMTYLEDMFGISVSYGQWIVFGMPFVVIMMPLLWLLLHWRFKPKITDMSPALDTLKRDIARQPGWTRKQKIAVIIFLCMLLGWITESNLIHQLTGIRLGIGVLAVAGAVAYLLFGVVSWRDYQEKVDWGVVWLYAGAIIFGRTLDSTGTAYWLARSIVEAVASVGVDSAQALIAVGSLVTAGMTNLMADGPAAAAVGPITLNMAGVYQPGTSLLPFMGLSTAAASSLAYLLVIGTPPNAIVYASGLLEPKDFLRVGIPAFILAFGVLMLLNLIYWPLLGFPGLKPM